MLENRLFRTIGNILFIFIGFLIFMSFGSKNDDYTGIMVAGMLIYIPWLVHQICWDFLDGLNFFIFGFLRRVLVIGVTAICILFGVVFYFTAEKNQYIFAAAGLVAPLVGAVVIELSLYKKWDRVKALMTPHIVMVASCVVGYVVYKVNNHTIAGLALLAACGFYLYLLFDKYGVYDLVAVSKRKSTSSASSSSYSSSSTSYSSGNGESDLQYYASDICDKYSTSRPLGFGVSVSSSVSKSFVVISPANELIFTCSFDIDKNSCSAETANEITMINNDIEKFQKEIMNDVHKEAKALVQRLFQKYPEMGDVKIIVKQG